MQTPRLRAPAASGAFFVTTLTLTTLTVALLSGCSVFPRRPAAPPPAAASPLPARYAAPLHPELGRVLSVQRADATVVIEFVPTFRPAPGLSGRELIVRDLTTLAEKARLTAAPYQRGRFLGAYLNSGTPEPGDEVVLAPAPSAP